MKKNINLKKAVYSAYVFICCMLSFQVANATHIAGADLTYEYVSGNTYRIHLTLYRDCSGNQMQQSEIVTIKSASCSQNYTINVNQDAGTGGEITFPCAGGGSTCAGGSSFGVQKWSYTGTTTLPANCSDWTFVWSRCCRNCAITTTIHGNCQSNNDVQSNIYIEAKLDNTSGSNNSPTFTVNPVATMCLGQNFVYNHGVVDPDGDVLIYSLIGSEVGAGTTVTYQPGYSAQKPINSTPALSMDTTTGDLKITPQSIEIGVMAVRIDEYRNGSWIGSVMRDMQFIVQTCNNTLPAATGINGTAAFDTTICPGTNLCFYIFTSDADGSQSVSLTSNNAIPNSGFNNSGGSRPTASFCWTPTPADARMTPWTFVVNVRDDACPTNGSQTYSFSITVPLISPTTVADDATGNIDLTVSGNSGPYTYLWSDGSTTEDVTGFAPGTYTVTVCDANGCCVNTQATINAPVNCTFPVGNQHQNVACSSACNGWIKLYPHGTPPYTYQWSTADTTKDIYNLCGGVYTSTVTDSQGCSHTCRYTINSSSALVASTTANNTCSGASIGSASVSVIGGTPLYTYLWDNGATTATISGLCPGIYCVVVTDQNGCSTSACATITSFQAINVVSSIRNATSLSACDGRYCIHTTGGTMPYTIVWSTGASSVSSNGIDSITGLCPGTYTVTVTDANGCSRKVVKNVGPVVMRFNALADQDLSGSGTIQRLGDDNTSNDVSLKASAIPNPFSNDFIIETGNDASVLVRIYNMGGALVGAYDNIMPGQRIGAELSSGLYILQIQQAGEVVYQRLAKQNQ